MTEEERGSRGEWKGGVMHLVLVRTQASGVALEERNGAGHLVGGCVHCSFWGQQRKRERRNVTHVLEEDLDFVQLDQEFVPYFIFAESRASSSYSSPTLLGL